MPPEHISLPAPAKLNLFLHITGRRADGYHTLQTVFRLLDWGDTLHLTRTDDGAITLQGPDLGIGDEDNLVVRAARALQAVPGAPPDAGAQIVLDKRIPTGAGLGGGSSDAASTLLALNQLWQLELSSAELLTIGGRLGADVPVFIAGRSAWAEGTGDLLTPLDLPSAWYLVVKPDCAVNTAQVFSHRELTRDSAPITIPAFFAGYSRNDCESVVRRLYEPVDKALIWLQKFGDAKLTGTGSCVFCSFANEAQARAAAEQVPVPWQAIVAAGIDHSPALEALAVN